MLSLNIVTLRNFPGLWGGRGDRGSEFPAFRTLYSRFPPPSLVVSRLCVLFLLQNIAQCCSFPISPDSPPPWISRLPPSLLPPPVHFPPTLLPSSRPLVPLHWPLSGSEAGGDFVLTQHSLLFARKCKLVSIVKCFATACNLRFRKNKHVRVKSGN